MTGEGLIVKVSAPGKVILHGEHSVVYGKLAIAASLDLRSTVTIQERQNNKLEIHFTDLKLKKKYDIKQIKALFKAQPFPLLEEDAEFTFQNPQMLNHEEYLALITTALKLDSDNIEKNHYLSLVSFFYLYFGILHSSEIPIEPLSVTVKTELSLGAGTGSSASLMVSLAGSLIRYLSLKAPDLKLKNGSRDNHRKAGGDTKVTNNFNEQELHLISKWAFSAEKIIHGNPSGIDNTVCTYGAMVSFRKGRAPIAVKSRDDIRGLLVDTKIPKNTGIMVKKVADFRERRHIIVDSLLEAMECVTDEALELLVHLGELPNSAENKIEDCYKELGELSDINHDLLRTLGVSHPALDDVVQVLNSNNLHGKLTGSGGGGYAITLIPPSMSSEEIEKVCEKLSLKGYHPQITKLGGSGVAVE